MITLQKTSVAQGDVLFRKIRRLPNGVVEQRRENRLIVTHSETGHHHAIDEAEVRLFERAERDPMICYLAVDGDFADVVHHRDHDTHETVRLPRGVYEVRRQEEYTPAGWRRVED